MVFTSVASLIQLLAHLVKIRYRELGSLPRMAPLSGCSSPNISFSKVDFPAPFGPSNPTRSPRMMRQEKSLMMGLASP